MTDPRLVALAAADPAMGALIARVGPCGLEADATGSHFQALVRNVVYQQLTGKAAGTILGRVLALFAESELTPEGLRDVSDDTLRAAGLSRAKVASVRAIAHHWQTESPPSDWSALDDEAIIAQLIRIRGIGRWSAQMFLMSRLGRPDVLAGGDLGLQKGLRRLDGLEALPSPAALVARGEIWRPYRSLASWYLWRLSELPVDEPPLI